MESIDRVVSQGRIVNTHHVGTGDPVYRNDEPFLKQRGLIVRVQLIVIGICIAVIAIELALFILTSNWSFIILVLSLSFLMLSGVIQIITWRGVDRGIVVHEEGVDTMEYRWSSIGRVFVPRDEMSHLTRGWLRFTIHLRHSNKRLFCHKNMVDEATIAHIERLIGGERPGPMKPELRVYGDDGLAYSMPRSRM